MSNVDIYFKEFYNSKFFFIQVSKIRSKISIKVFEKKGYKYFIIQCIDMLNLSFCVKS